MCTQREPNIMSVLQEINKNLEKLLEQFVDKDKPTNPYDMSEVKKKWDKESKIPGAVYIVCPVCEGKGMIHNTSMPSPYRCPKCNGEGSI